MRSSGILLHISSLPSRYGIGDFGPEAFAFVDFLKLSKQSRWQILPLNPTDGINGHSPYSCFSAFAGNPLYISPEVMVSEGFLSKLDIKATPAFDGALVDYSKVASWKERLFATAYVKFAKRQDRKAYLRFCEEQQDWLDDYAVFITAKAVFEGKSWGDWPQGLRSRQKLALNNFVRQYAEKIECVKFIQFLFFSQWARLKDYANSHGIKIVGDIPIYVNYDSVEVWCYPSFFKLNDKHQPKFVSGCPPDYFSKTGQRWGNPVYDWSNLKKDKYRWWVLRIEHNLRMFDFLRIDHFRGFVSFWQIPAHEKFAIFGRWVKGPGKDLFKTLKSKFKHLPLIAEDLGEITPDVIQLMQDFNLPGMRVLLFAFGGDLNTNPHVPANYQSNAVAYTGTHDNNTIQGWIKTEANPHEKANILRLLSLTKLSAKDIHWTMIQSLMLSKANTVIIPMGDILGLKEIARMNTPATKANNWKWRLKKDALSGVLAKKLAKLTIGSGRVKQ